MFFPLTFIACKKKDNGKGYRDFPKKINIFGINILGSEKVEDSKIIHAAKIMAQYLDNDENGIVDNQEWWIN
ncbi:MAG: hypothetical protein CM1200mP1_03320 [Candidatus Neomarinimicrobiota bacterium]|nr:MAG: hypothetical protein CM1200mP1_03320 [Candidatus Neomarinimicrobiota bacterium]